MAVFSAPPGARPSASSFATSGPLQTGLAGVEARAWLLKLVVEDAVPGQRSQPSILLPQGLSHAHSPPFLLKQRSQACRLRAEPLPVFSGQLELDLLLFAHAARE